MGNSIFSGLSGGGSIYAQAGGGGGSIFGNGTGPPSGDIFAPGPNNPVTSAQSGINTDLGIISGAGNGSIFKQAQKVASGGGHGSNWFGDVLSALDIPRAAVVSGIDQLTSGRPSFSGWLKGTETHETTGHLLNDLGIHNHLVDSIGGVIGDVAFDPLTYVGGLGEIGRTAGAVGRVAEAVSSADKASRLADAAGDAEDALKAVQSSGDVGSIAGATADFTAKKAAADEAFADAATKTGGGTITGDTLSRLKTSGLAGLNDDERSLLESQMGTPLKTGLGFRIPGTKLAGNAVRVPLVTGEKVDAISSGLHQVAAKIGDTRFANRLEEAFVPMGGLKSAARSAALNGDGERAAAIQNVMRLQPESVGVARDTVNQFGRQGAEALNQIPEGVMQHVTAALEGDSGAKAAIQAGGGGDGLDALQATYAQMLKHAEELGAPAAQIEDYSPHQLTDAAREALAKSGGKVTSARRAFGSTDAVRAYKPGDTFLGQKLETGSVDEMNQIAHDVYGKDAFDVFRSDPREVFANYVRGYARRMGEQHLANRLDDLGVSLDGQLALPPQEWQAMAQNLASRATEAAATSARLGKQAEKVGRVVDTAAAGLAPHSPGLSGALQRITTEMANKGIPLEGRLQKTPVASLDQILQHGGDIRSRLETLAGQHGQSAANLRSGASTIRDAYEKTGADLVPLGSTGASVGRVATPDVLHALQKLNEIQANGVKGGALLKYYDKALNVWKQYALAMPGKAIRHAVATPAWGAYLADVGTSSLREGFRGWRQYQKGGLDAVESPKMRDEIQGFLDQGISHGHDFDTREVTGPQTRTQRFNARTHNPLSTQNGYFKANQEMQRRGQDYWRFAMYHDAMARKGMLAPEAAAKVRRFLGDPHGITNAERSTLRRLVPFYTFLRQNLPVELGSLATQPGKFINAYEAPKQEIESLSQAPGIVPNYFGQTLSVRLPWKIGGSQTYVSPDLPFTRIGSLFGGINQLEGQTSPLIQDALAVANHSNVYTGQQFSPYAKTAPGAWSDIPGLMPLLHQLAPGSVVQEGKTASDYGVTTPKGAWEITPQAESIIESLLPPLAQARRLYTTEPNMKARGDTTLLSNLLGQNFRTDDPYQQASELYTRQAALKALIENLQNKGNLPKYIYGFHP